MHSAAAVCAEILYNQLGARLTNTQVKYCTFFVCTYGSALLRFDEFKIYVQKFAFSFVLEPKLNVRYLKPLMQI